jgi:glycolate oxidase iron-sulfur subunit
VGPPGATPARLAAGGERRRVVGLVRGCVQSAFFGQVTDASARLLAAAGCDVAAPLGQPCCGALSMHSGREEEARRFARRMIDQFEQLGVEHVVVDAAGCGSALKEYGRLLARDPRYAARAAAFAASVRDLSEELAGLAPASAARAEPVGAAPAAGAEPLRVAYHDACHLAHAQGITAQPRQLIAALDGVRLVELDDPYCCGSAGIYNLLQVKPARELGDRKAAAVGRSGADVVVTANPGCMMQIRAALGRAGSTLPVMHLAELLDAARAGRLPAVPGVPGAHGEVAMPATEPQPSQPKAPGGGDAETPEHGDPAARPTPGEHGGAAAQDELVDEEERESFPASDPPATWAGPDGGPRS